MKGLRIGSAALLLMILVAPLYASADIRVQPFLIDVSLSPRESTSEVIRLESSYEARKAVLFATVNEITIGEDGEIKEFVPPVMSDRTNSITSWIEIQRGRIEVPAREQADIPISIKVHPYAEPGEYHAFIGIVEAPKRYLAEEVALSGQADGVVLKVVVADERVNSMRITDLSVDRFITDTTAQDITVTVANPGEIASSPVGELVFYNNRGTEIAAATVNDADLVIAPGDERTFTVSVPESVAIGKYKANVNLHYGTNQRANLYDTTSFFFIPWWYQVVFAILLLTLLILFVVLYRRTKDSVATNEHGDEVALFVRDGHNQDAKHHDIDLSE